MLDERCHAQEVICPTCDQAGSRAFEPNAIERAYETGRSCAVDQVLDALKLKGKGYRKAVEMIERMFKEDAQS